MPGIKGDDMALRKKVLADIVASRGRGGMRSTPRSGFSKRKPRKIANVAQGAK